MAGCRHRNVPTYPGPQDLNAFVRSKGGMSDPGGDLRSMGLHDLIAKPGRGVSQDHMRLMAAEAGYLGGDTARAMAETHPNDLLDAVSGRSSGARGSRPRCCGGLGHL